MAPRKKSSKEKKRDREARKRRATAKRQSTWDAAEFIDFVSAVEAERGDLPKGAVEALGALFSMSSGWDHFNSSDYKPIAKRLAPLDPFQAIPIVSGLTTDSRFQTAKARLEVFLHLVVAHARGRARLALPLLRRCVENDFSKLPIRRMEDPPEDVFVSNVVAIGGNYRIFEGSWESADKSLPALLEAFIQTELSDKLPHLTTQMLALLRLSEEVAERAGLERWHIGRNVAPTNEFLPDDLDLRLIASREGASPVLVRDAREIQVDFRRADRQGDDSDVIGYAHQVRRLSLR